MSSSLLSFGRRFAIACLIVAALATAGVVAGDAYERNAFQHSRKVHLANGVLHRTPPGAPANYLLIGSDSRQAVDTGSNADVMMVLHVEPATRAGFLVSFPRDLVVDIPGHGRRLLNAAYGLGGTNGPALVIQTLEQNFKPLTIQHYIEVDFGGFQDIVNAIGGVHLWFPTPVHDPYIGLDVERAGCVAMNGAGALKYARSRHYYVPKDLQHPAPWSWNYDAQTGGKGWFTSGTDIDRIPRQQYFLRTISQAAVDKTASNPTKLFGLLDAVRSNFAHDDTLKFSELKALIRTFNGLDPTRVDMTTLPNEPGTGRWDQNVFVKQPNAAVVIARLANRKAPPGFIPTVLPPGKVRMRVVNGSGVKGLAKRVLDTYLAAGFKSAGAPADADRSDYAHTQVRFAPGKGAAGITAMLAAGTTHLSEALSARDTLGGDALLIVGRDWDRLTHKFTFPRGATASSTTAVSTSTTTTTAPLSRDVRFVPLNPKTGGPLVGCPS